ncbi:bifunctional 2-polyprenyl-6-hydroxyphenol methylase/3-demethylubiquinol 3-O-methyltransferase UbiG [Flavobacterium sp.]|uniref:class I SAM-dependent methyltransferase n=1 Tax=Flavobacterium sp. TaxID=239 RepID=UPI0025DE39A9|nr:class I SAM-dependent methyltransferase [Flavobacterium sp.]
MKNNTQDYLAINKATWNDKVDVHMASSFYDMEAFLQGKSTLNDIELALLGDVSGKKILHLQCHFGQDSLSLARMGAQVTGVDLSDKAIERARELAEKLNLEATFVCCDIYEAPHLIDEQFDIVFTSYGTIGWLPDLERWAAVVAHFLKPNGQLIMADFHPVVWMYDNDFTTVFYDYFNVAQIVEAETGTYADREAPIANQTITWNHPISEILNALINSGLEIKRFNEYDYSPYDCFNQTEEFEKGKYRIQAFGNKIPMVYAILAIKK